MEGDASGVEDRRTQGQMVVVDEGIWFVLKVCGPILLQTECK
jgi:hypothetical protein